MSVNPEFRRNLWLHVSWQRLFAAPTISVLVVAALMAAQKADMIFQAGQFACFIILGLWGTRRAADSLSEEVSGGTWESQRMSGLGAWQMAWGKLIGGTAFVWYCAAFALLILVAARVQMEPEVGDRNSLALTVYSLAFGGLFAQCVSFAAAIILLRKAVSYRRLTITLAQTCGFVTFFAFTNESLHFSGAENPFNGAQGLIEPQKMVFGHTVQLGMYDAIAITIFGAWIALAIYRLMRLELQYRNWPWAWTAFVAFMLLFAASLNQIPALGPVGWLLSVTAMGAVLTYLSLFADVRDPVRYRWALRAIWSGDFGQALSYTPWWLVSFTATVGAAVAAIVLIPGVEFFDMSGVEVLHILGPLLPQQVQISLAMLLLFMLRDILVVLWLSAGPKRHRADVAGLIFLMLVYMPLALILWGAGGKAFLPLVMPISMSGHLLDIVPILVEILLVGGMLVSRWRAATRLGKKY